MNNKIKIFLCTLSLALSSGYAMEGSSSETEAQERFYGKLPGHYFDEDGIIKRIKTRMDPTRKQDKAEKKEDFELAIKQLKNVISSDEVRINDIMKINSLIKTSVGVLNNKDSLKEDIKKSYNALIDSIGSDYFIGPYSKKVFRDKTPTPEEREALLQGAQRAINENEEDITTLTKRLSKAQKLLPKVYDRLEKFQ